jgi:hypothetical protein
LTVARDTRQICDVGQELFDELVVELLAFLRLFSDPSLAEFG